MRFLIVLFFVMLPVFVFAQQDHGAKFQFKDGDVHDFGIIKRGAEATDTFWFINTGDDALIIQDVTPSCGCTSVSWTRSPVQKNGQGYISLSLITEEQHGVFNKEVYIQSTATNNPHGEKRYTLHIKGDARDKLPKKKSKSVGK